MEQLGASYFQGSYIQGGRQVSGSLTDNTALRDSCERIERIEKVIHGNQLLKSGDICLPCLYDVSRRIDRHIRDQKLVKKSYTDFLQRSSSEASIGTQQRVPSSTSRAIDQYLKSVDLAHLQAASEDLARDIQQLEEEERYLKEQEAKNCTERHKLLQELSEQSWEQADLEYELSQYEQNLPRLHTLLDASGHELIYLQRKLRKNTLDTATLPFPINLAPLFDTVQIYGDQYGILNGRRLAFVELPQCNLEWDEINASWSNLATMVLCIRNNCHLPSGLHLQNAHHSLYHSLLTSFTANSVSGMDNGDTTAGIQATYEYKHIVQLRPFHDHTLLQVHCTRTPLSSARTTTISASTNNANTTSTLHNPSVHTTNLHNSKLHHHHNTHHTTINTHMNSQTVTNSTQQSNAKNSSNNSKSNSNNNNTNPYATREFVLHLEGGVCSSGQDKSNMDGRHVHTQPRRHPSQATATSSSRPANNNNTNHNHSLDIYDSSSSTHREYRTAVLTLACTVVSTILDIHYNHTSSVVSTNTNTTIGNTITTNGTVTIDGGSVNRKLTLLDALFDGVIRDLACVLLTIGDQLSFAVPPQPTVHPHTLYTSTVIHSKVANLTNTTTIPTTNNLCSDASTSPVYTNTTVNVGAMNASSLASSVLASSTLLRTTLFDSVAYFGNYTGISSPTTTTPTNKIPTNSTGAYNVSNSNTNTNINTVPIVPANPDNSPLSNITTHHQVISTANSPLKPSERAGYDTSPSNPNTPREINYIKNDSIIQKYQRRVQLLVEYKQYCLHTHTVCDVYSALLVCSELELREVEVMQKVVMDLLYTMRKNFSTEA